METEGIQATPLAVYPSESNEDVQTQNSALNGHQEGNSDNSLSDLSQVDVRENLTGLRARTLEELYDLYRKHSCAIGFVVRSTTQRTDRDGNIIEKYYVCSCEGYTNGKKEAPAETSLKPRRKVKKFLKTRTGCKANIRIKFIRGAYEVKHHLTTHNHELVRTYLQRDERRLTEEEAKSLQGFSIANLLKGSSFFDTIETEAGGDESGSNMLSETPLKRPKSCELSEKNDDVPPGFGGSTRSFAPSLDSMNPEGKSEAELKKLVDCGSTLTLHYLKAVPTLVAMKEEQLKKQAESLKQEILKRKEMEEKLEQLQGERDHIFKRGFKDVCSKLLASDEFGQRMCNALFAGRDCVVSKNSKASHDALIKALELVQSVEYNLLDAIHPAMSFDAFKAWSSDTGNHSSASLSTAPFFQA